MSSPLQMFEKLLVPLHPLFILFHIKYGRKNKKKNPNDRHDINGYEKSHSKWKKILLWIWMTYVTFNILHKNDKLFSEKSKNILDQRLRINMLHNYRLTSRSRDKENMPIYNYSQAEGARIVVFIFSHFGLSWNAA